MSFLFLPLSFIYCFISWFRYLFCKKYYPKIPVISVGNLIAGGSGKSPFIISLAKKYKNSCVVLRGYKRDTKGLILVSYKGKILTDVNSCGDEAMMIAKETDATVIVSKDRKEAIKKAKELGCRVVFLDDGFRHCIDKFDILIDVDVKNYFCLPSGPYRLPGFLKKRASLVVREGIDFKREVKILNPTSNMLFLTSIANPKRLERFLPKGIKKIYFPDHYNFSKEDIEKIYLKHRPDSFLVTSKDLVKLEKFNFSYSLLKLDLKIKEEVFNKIDSYIKDFYAKKTTNGSDAS